MKQTFVAVVDIDTIDKYASDKEYIKQAQAQGSLYTLREFEEALNDDDIHLSNEFIRFVNVSVEVIV